MKAANTIVHTIARITLFGVLSITAACGGGSDEPDPCEQAADGIFPILNGLACLSGSTDGNISKGQSSGTTALASPMHDGAATQSEYEPNGILSNANPVTFADAGTSISGRVDFGSDSTDAFVFAPATGGNYEIYLCAATCEDRLESDVLTLSVLDHSQSTIAGTPLDTVSEQSVAVMLDAGFAYYVEVSAYQFADNYRLVIAPAVD